MLSYTQQSSNNFFIFFEEGEILKLREGRISGHYINVNCSNAVGNLEAVIDDKTCRAKMQQVAITTEVLNGVISSMIVAMMQRVYDSLVERGEYADHQGFRHVHLIDTMRELPFSLAPNYDYLRSCVTRV